MKELLINPWFQGIIGGVISGLIVYFVTDYLFDKKTGKEYLQKVETANNEILYSIRPLIIEKKIPTKSIFNSIISSTAKKYGIKQDDLYNEISITNDLINEIIGNPFLVSDQKFELCNILESIKEYNKETSTHKSNEIIYINEKHNISSKYSSSILAITAAAMTMYMAVTEFNQPKLGISNEKYSLIISTFIPIAITGLFFMITRIKSGSINQKNEIDNFMDDIHNILIGGKKLKKK